AIGVENLAGVPGVGAEYESEVRHRIAGYDNYSNANTEPPGGRPVRPAAARPERRQAHRQPRLARQGQADLRADRARLGPRPVATHARAASSGPGRGGASTATRCRTVPAPNSVCTCP